MPVTCYWRTFHVMLGLQSRDHAKKRKENTSLQQCTLVCTTYFVITINNLKYKRSIFFRRAHSHVVVNLINHNKWLVCSTEVLVVQLRDVPFWTTPQWRTSDFVFLHLLLYRPGTEWYLTIILDQACNYPCRHAIILPFLPRTHNCCTFEGSVVFFLFL